MLFDAPLTAKDDLRDLIVAYGYAVVTATKLEGMGKGANAAERRAAAKLFKAIYGRKPTPSEIDNLIPK